MQFTSDGGFVSNTGMRLVASICVLSVVALGQDTGIEVRLGAGIDPPRDIAGISVPKPPPGYYSPVSKSCSVIQGHGGAFSHKTLWSRYAWDFAVPPGTPVVAARAGVVVRARLAGNVGGNDQKQFGHAGNVVVVDHLDGTATSYVHLQRELLPRARVGEYVVAGEVIGAAGDTGFVVSPHLHYTVIDPRTQRSVPSRFADFKRNDGVPRKGNSVRAAPVPAVPQETMVAYKRIVRAAVAARRAGYPDLAWRFLTELHRRQIAPAYFYEKVRQALVEKTRADVERLLKDPPDDVADRLAHVLARTELAAAVPRGAHPDKAVALWVDGLRAGFLGSPWDGLASFAKARRLRDDPRFAKGARAALKSWQGEQKRRLDLTLHEATIALPWHKRRVLDDAEQWARRARDRKRLRTRLFPAEKKAASTEYRAFKERAKDVQRTLNRR